jgi:hypothetical protein
MRITLLLLLAGSLLLGACNNSDVADDDQVMINTGFDELIGWVDNGVGSLTKEDAYNGRYSWSVGAGREYSLTFVYPLGELTTSKPRKLRIQAWVKTDQVTTLARMVIEVGNPNSTERTFWKPLPVFAVNEPNKWVKSETEVELPADITSNQTLHVYLWANNAATPVYLDNLRISKIE